MGEMADWYLGQELNRHMIDGFDDEELDYNYISFEDFEEHEFCEIKIPEWLCEEKGLLDD